MGKTNRAVCVLFTTVPAVAECIMTFCARVMGEIWQFGIGRSISPTKVGESHEGWVRAAMLLATSIPRC